MTITEFLLERIAEDEEVASNRHETYCGWCLHEGPGFDDDGCQCNYPARVLAECDAKRRIVELHSDFIEPEVIDELRILAGIYSDHPDFEQEWAL